MNICISGMGIVSALGIGVDENKKALMAGETGVSKLELIPSVHQGVIPVGEVKYSSETLQKLIKDSSKKISRTATLAVIAAQEALHTAGISKDELQEYNVGVISSSTAGGMRESEKFFKGFLAGNNTSNFIEAHDGTDATEQIMEYLGLSGFHTTINTACSSSANAIILGARMIKNGMLDMAIVGGSDALSKFTINGFNSLLLLDPEQCKPFDDRRIGINLGEGAGYLILESEKTLNARKQQAKAILSGYAITNDAYHPSATSPVGTGLQQSMEQAITMAGITKEDIHYINAHGTATPNNDLTEGMAMKQFFEDKVPPFSSTKSYTGHCLAAAGSIETIFSILAMQQNCVFPNLNFKEIIPKHELIPIKEVTHKENVTHVLSNSAGMGGFCSTIIISDHP